MWEQGAPGRGGGTGAGAGGRGGHHNVWLNLEDGDTGVFSCETALSQTLRTYALPVSRALPC